MRARAAVSQRAEVGSGGSGRVLLRREFVSKEQARGEGSEQGQGGWGRRPDLSGRRCYIWGTMGVGKTRGTF